MDTIPTPMELATTYRYVRRERLEDYPGTAICRRGTHNNAFLDCGLQTTVSDPDFSTHGWGPSFEQAAENCKAAIVRNASGQDISSSGKRRDPCRCLTGYDLHYRLMPHWERKLLMLRLGDDPNTAIRTLYQGDTWSRWPLNGQWLERSSGGKHLEFFFQVCLSIGRAQCHTTAQAEAFGLEVADAVLAEIKEHMGRRLFATQLTHPTVRVRATQALLAHIQQQEHALADA
jgi:hypothetical protein